MLARQPPNDKLKFQARSELVEWWVDDALAKNIALMLYSRYVFSE